MTELIDSTIKKFGLSLELLAGASIDGTSRRDAYEIVAAPNTLSIGSTPYDLYTRNALRFSNSLMQISNMLHLARCMGARAIYVPDYWYIPAGGFHTTDGIMVSSTQKYVPTGVTFKGTFFYLHSLRPICRDVPMNRSEILKDIREFLTINYQPPLQNDDLVIHVRAGDIFTDAQPHPGYGQPPFAYYEKIISSRTWSQVYVVCEDFTNPVTSLIESYCETNGIPFSFVSGDLKDDIEFLLRAKNLVSGRGSFIPGIVALSEHVRTVYFFESLFSTWDNSKINVKKISDLTGEYKSKIFSNNWINSSEQLDLMRNYPISNVGFV